MPDPASVIRQAFGDISADELVALCEVARVAAYPAGHILCREGELEHVFYIVAEGQVAITQSLGHDGERLLALRHPGRWASVSAFAPIAAPMHCPWGEKAFTGYLGEDRAAWAAQGWAEVRAGRLTLLPEGWLRLDALVAQAAVP